MARYVDGVKGYPTPWSPREAFFYAAGQVHHPYQDYSMRCDGFVGRCYGWAASGEQSAIIHWYDIPWQRRHRLGTPPAGALVFWNVGRYGHVALADGHGNVFSNDIKRAGKIDRVPQSLITRNWGAKYLGWANPVFPKGSGRNPDAKPVL